MQVANIEITMERNHNEIPDSQSSSGAISFREELDLLLKTVMFIESDSIASSIHHSKVLSMISLHPTQGGSTRGLLRKAEG